MNVNPVANSLETLHNTMHGRIGGAGHMGDPISAGVYLLYLPRLLIPDSIFPRL